MDHSSAFPSLESLAAVQAAASTGSFSAAAAALDVTHGAVSRRVAAVEAWAQMRVFERHGRGVRLTLDGQRLVARVEQALAMLDDSVRLPRRDAGLDPVRISVVPSFARLWLLPALAELEGTPPDLRIDLDIDHRLMTLSDARIAIRHGRGDWAGVKSEPLFVERLVPVACLRIADELGPDPEPAALLRYPLIHDSSDATWRQWLAAAGLEPERRLIDRSFVDYDLALQAAAAGVGIALLRPPYGSAFAARLGLRPVSRHTVPHERTYHIVSRRGAPHGAVERLIARLRACSAAQAEQG